MLLCKAVCEDDRTSVGSRVRQGQASIPSHTTLRYETRNLRTMHYESRPVMTCSRGGSLQPCGALEADGRAPPRGGFKWPLAFCHVEQGRPCPARRWRSSHTYTEILFHIAEFPEGRRWVPEEGIMVNATPTPAPDSRTQFIDALRDALAAPPEPVSDARRAAAALEKLQFDYPVRGKGMPRGQGAS